MPRTVAVTGPNGTLGHVSAVVLLAPLASSLAARTGVEVAWFTRGAVRAGALAGWRPSGPVPVMRPMRH
jgi:hypothetical protein